jgi:hypothetical protein
MRIIVANVSFSLDHDELVLFNAGGLFIPGQHQDASVVRKRDTRWQAGFSTNIQNKKK